MTSTSSGIKAFLDKRTFDPSELLAKRAINCVHELRRLAQNFAVRGKSALTVNAQEGLKAALYGFCCLNVHKRFFFANQVDGNVEAFTAHIKSEVQGLNEETARLLADDAVDFAEGMVAVLRPLHRPVASVSGVSSVQILRGDHFLAAMAKLSPANNN